MSHFVFIATASDIQRVWGILAYVDKDHRCSFCESRPPSTAPQQQCTWMCRSLHTSAANRQKFMTEPAINFIFSVLSRTLRKYDDTYNIRKHTPRLPKSDAFCTRGGCLQMLPPCSSSPPSSMSPFTPSVEDELSWEKTQPGRSGGVSPVSVVTGLTDCGRFAIRMKPPICESIHTLGDK